MDKCNCNGTHGEHYRDCPRNLANRRGGKRDGAGRPAPLGRKETCTVRLTPDAAEFCRQHPDGFPVLEKKLRKSKEFRDWLTNSRKRGGKQR